MATTVEIPSVGPNASIIEIHDAIATRLQSIADVLQAEHKWFDHLVAFSRKIDGGEESIAFELKNGWIDEETAEHRRTEDNLTILKAKVDKHLHNMSTAGVILADAAETIRGIVELGKRATEEGA
ncbi:hypothetical protein [Mesorhizobium caraganae]|uniref:hypothetical protein n=1 Tax=Mesorhizobium caraganae TaxID=483206 RepID=UPI00177E0EDC|nr:hypothetical protein [Mesorhizobium caraganae]